MLSLFLSSHLFPPKRSYSSQNVEKCCLRFSHFIYSSKTFHEAQFPLLLLLIPPKPSTSVLLFIRLSLSYSSLSSLILPLRRRFGQGKEGCSKPQRASPSYTLSSKVFSPVLTLSCCTASVLDQVLH